MQEVSASFCLGQPEAPAANRLRLTLLNVFRYLKKLFGSYFRAWQIIDTDESFSLTKVEVRTKGRRICIQKRHSFSIPRLEDFP